VRIIQWTIDTFQQQFLVLKLTLRTVDESVDGTTHFIGSLDLAICTHNLAEGVDKLLMLPMQDFANGSGRIIEKSWGIHSFLRSHH